jgi:predicted Zn-dependent protease
MTNQHQQYFYELADWTTSKLQAHEVYTAWLSGEESDFCRLNGGKVRQAGNVRQVTLSLRLIRGGRNAQGSVALALVTDDDRARVGDLVKTLRDQLAELPEDPYLLYETTVRSTETKRTSKLTDPREVVSRVTARAGTNDLVGIYAAGGVFRGFANSLGQRNWFETYSFNFDWSLYLRADKAVKTGYAGFEWSDGEFERKLDGARSQLGVLERAPRTVKPGRYRVYLSPQALTELTDILSWGGFSLKAHRTKQTPLLRMVEGGARMQAAVTMTENTKDGLSPNFNSSGYLKPDAVRLVDAGAFEHCLVSPRSSKEYGVATNGASDSEGPSSLEIGAGTLPQAEVLQRLGQGVYVNNLWYLNYSDRPACRVTGMTRFASFWVEGGKIAAPLDVMRFDESVLRMLGDNLEGLTKEREMILSSSTYGERSTDSVHLPGALVNDFAFTL